MYQENEKFVNYVTNLDYTTKSYNKVRLTILDVENPLVEKQLEEIDKKLSRAEKELSWSTPGKILLRFFLLVDCIHINLYTHSIKSILIVYVISICIELFVIESKRYQGLFCIIVLFCFVMSIYIFIHYVISINR